MILYAVLLCLPLIQAIPDWPYDRERVVGGENAKPGEIPYIVSFRYYSSHICGGSILDATHILTAAHCVAGMSPSALSIQHSVTHITSSGNTVINVVKVFPHEKYNNFLIQNDVAVLKLKEPISFTANAQPVNLPGQDAQPPANQWGVLAGWGLPYSGGSVMKDLQRVDLLIYSDADCKSAHGSNVNDEHNLCGGVPEGGKGQCNGDSGGPLVGPDDKQYGVVSWSVKPCTVKGYPGVYARVTTYVDWIKEKQEL